MSPPVVLQNRFRPDTFYYRDTPPAHQAMVEERACCRLDQLRGYGRLERLEERFLVTAAFETMMLGPSLLLGTGSAALFQAGVPPWCLRLESPSGVRVTSQASPHQQLSLQMLGLWGTGNLLGVHLLLAGAAGALFPVRMHSGRPAMEAGMAAVQRSAVLLFDLLEAPRALARSQQSAIYSSMLSAKLSGLHCSPSPGRGFQVLPQKACQSRLAGSADTFADQQKPSLRLMRHARYGEQRSRSATSSTSSLASAAGPPSPEATDPGDGAALPLFVRTQARNWRRLEGIFRSTRSEDRYAPLCQPSSLLHPAGLAAQIHSEQSSPETTSSYLSDASEVCWSVQSARILHWLGDIAGADAPPGWLNLPA